MHSKLTTEEILELFVKRFYAALNDMRGEEKYNRNDVLATLKDFVESYSQGQLRIVAASTLTASSGDVKIEGKVSQ